MPGEAGDGALARVLRVPTRRPRSTLVGLAAIVVIALGVLGARGVPTAFGVDRLVAADDPLFVRWQELGERFGRDDGTAYVFAVRDGWFTVEGAREAIALSRDLEAAPFVLEVTGVATTGVVLDHDGVAQVGPPLTPARIESLGPDGLRRLGAQLASEPVTRGRLVSADGRALVFAIRSAPGTDATALAGHVEATVAKHGAPGVEFICTGGPLAQHAYRVFLRADTRRFIALMCVLLAAALAVTFRHALGVVLPLATVLLALLLTFAFMAAARVPVNLLGSAIPVLVLVTGISDAVHLLARYDEELRGGRAAQDALERAVAITAHACLLTSLTTASGFFALLATSAPMLGELGLSIGAGVLLAYVVSLTLVPAVAALRPPPTSPLRASTTSSAEPPPQPSPALVGVGARDGVVTTRAGDGEEKSSASESARSPQDERPPRDERSSSPSPGSAGEGRGGGSMRPALDPGESPALRRWAERVVARPMVSTIAVLAVVGALLAIGGPRLRIESRVVDDLPPGSPVVQAREAVDRLVGGNFPVTLVVHPARGDGPPEEDPALLARLAEFERALLAGEDPAAPFLGGSISLASIVSMAWRQLGGEGALPPTREGVAQTLLVLGGGEVARFVDRRDGALRVVLRVRDRGTHATAAFLARAEVAFRGVFGDSARLEPQGFVVLAHHTHQGIVRDALSSFALDLVVVALLLGPLFRSARLVVLALVPNLVPLAVTLSVMGLCGIDLRLGTSIVFTIVFGIAVDDTVHVLARYHEERSAGLAPREAVTRTVATGGRALLLMALVLAAGFSVLLLSEFAPTRSLGLLMAVTVAAGVLADLVLLPALLVLGDRA